MRFSVEIRFVSLNYFLPPNVINLKYIYALILSCSYVSEYAILSTNNIILKSVFVMLTHRLNLKYTNSYITNNLHLIILA